MRLKDLSHPFYDFDSHPVCGMRPISPHAAIREPSIISCTRYAPGGEVQLSFSLSRRSSPLSAVVDVSTELSSVEWNEKTAPLPLDRICLL